MNIKEMDAKKQLLPVLKALQACFNVDLEDNPHPKSSSEGEEL
jgi:hypothetical protein